MTKQSTYKRHSWIAVSLLLAFFFGCAQPKPSSVVPKSGSNASGDNGKDLRVAFISNNPEEFWLIAKVGTAKAEKDLGVKVDFRMPHNSSAAEQRQIIEDLMTQGVRYFAVSVNDAANQVDFYDDLIEKGATVITQDTDLPPRSKRLCYIGTNNFEAGKAAGDLVKKAIPDGGKVAIFVGQLDKANAVERRNGVIASLAGLKTLEEAGDLVKKGYPLITAGKYSVIGTYTDNIEHPRCKANAEDAITKNPDLACMVGLYAYNPPLLLQAAKDQNKADRIRIVGFDEDARTLQGIRDGTIVGTIVQQPFEFGYQSVKTLVDVARGDRSSIPANGVRNIPHKVIEKGNVDEFEKQLKELTGKR
jgi:ribose transport system substrate-binding protein